MTVFGLQMEVRLTAHRGKAFEAMLGIPLGTQVIRSRSYTISQVTRWQSAAHMKGRKASPAQWRHLQRLKEEQCILQGLGDVLR